MTTSLPLPSALTTFISNFTNSQRPTPSSSYPEPSSDQILSHPHPNTTSLSSTRSPYIPLALQVLHQLQHAHDWTLTTIHILSPLTGAPLSRPLVSGRPPARVYVHPDEQVEILARERAGAVAGVGEGKEGEGQVDVQQGQGDGNGNGEAESGNRKGDDVEREWVVPTSLAEKWSLRRFAEVFDAIGEEPPLEDGVVQESESGGDGQDGRVKGKGRKRIAGKRVLLAVVGDDSAIAFYVVHEGIVKPRQN